MPGWMKAEKDKIREGLKRRRDDPSGYRNAIIADKPSESKSPGMGKAATKRYGSGKVIEKGVRP